MELLINELNENLSSSFKCTKSVVPQKTNTKSLVNSNTAKTEYNQLTRTCNVAKTMVVLSTVTIT